MTEFKEQYNHYTVSMKMETNNTLMIEIEDSISFNKWRKVIDGQFINEQKDPFYSTIFTEPQLIFDYIRDNFSEVSFKPNTLSFIYSYGSANNRRTQIMTIPLEIKEIDRTDLAHVRIDKMRQEFTKKLTQRDTKIRSLEVDSLEMKNLLMKLTTEVRELSGLINKEQQQNIKLQETCKKIHQRLNKEEEKNKQLQERLKRQEKILLLLQQGQKEVNTFATEKVQFLNESKEKDPANQLQMSVRSNKSLKQEKRFVKIYQVDIYPTQPISHHPNNSQSKYFVLSNSTLNSAKITRVGSNGYFNFVNQSEISTKQVSRYSVKVLKNRNLLFGFCTDKGLGNTANYTNIQSAYYDCSGSGRFHEGGVSKILENDTIIDGTELKCAADLQQGKFYWLRDGKPLEECQIPKAMKEKTIYLSIILYWAGDEVQVNSG